MPPVLSIPRPAFEKMCADHSPELSLALPLLPGSLLPALECIDPTGAPLDARRLLVAMGGRESSFGMNMKPRYEREWDAGGSVWKGSAALQKYIARYRTAGACSYGPLQVMAFNTPSAPQDLAADPELALQGAIAFFNRYVIAHWRSRTLQQICRCWNAGHPDGVPTPGYVDEVWQYYQAA